MPTQGNLIELLPFFVDAEYADVANVVMAAGVHAARNVEIYIAKVMHKVSISELALNGFCNGYGLGVGQRAKIAARAADDISDQACVGRCQVRSLCVLPKR